MKTCNMHDPSIHRSLISFRCLKPYVGNPTEPGGNCRLGKSPAIQFRFHLNVYEIIVHILFCDQNKLRFQISYGQRASFSILYMNATQQIMKSLHNTHF